MGLAAKSSELGRVELEAAMASSKQRMSLLASRARGRHGELVEQGASHASLTSSGSSRTLRLGVLRWFWGWEDCRRGCWFSGRECAACVTSVLRIRGGAIVAAVALDAGVRRRWCWGWEGCRHGCCFSRRERVPPVVLGMGGLSPWLLLLQMRVGAAGGA